MKKRIQAIISAAGICSRRNAEKMIEDGRVTVNGAPVSLGMSADDACDDIAVDGVSISSSSERTTIILNKPKGYVTTLNDERGRKTVAQLVEGTGKRLYPVGRLDMDTSGLLIMTDDGDLAFALAHPSHLVDKTYFARVSGDAAGSVSKLSSGLVVDGKKTSPAHVKLLKVYEDGGELEITIHEGRNRQVRKMCSACGLKVRDLKRISEGEITLKGLSPGEWRLPDADESKWLLKMKNSARQ